MSTVIAVDDHVSHVWIAFWPGYCDWHDYDKLCPGAFALRDDHTNPWHGLGVLAAKIPLDRLVEFEGSHGMKFAIGLWTSDASVVMAGPLYADSWILSGAENVLSAASGTGLEVASIETRCELPIEGD